MKYISEVSALWDFVEVKDKIQIKGLAAVGYLGAPLQIPRQRLLILVKLWLHFPPSLLPRVSYNFVSAHLRVLMSGCKLATSPLAQAPRQYLPMSPPNQVKTKPICWPNLKLSWNSAFLTTFQESPPSTAPHRNAGGQVKKN